MKEESARETAGGATPGGPGPGRVRLGEEVSSPCRHRVVIPCLYRFDNRCALKKVPPTRSDFAVGTDAPRRRIRDRRLFAIGIISPAG
jgi:hypothetical protein